MYVTVFAFVKSKNLRKAKRHNNIALQSRVRQQIHSDGAVCMHGQVQYYVFLLLNGRTNKQITRIMSNVEPVIMSFCFSEVPAVEHHIDMFFNCAVLKESRCHGLMGA